MDCRVKPDNDGEGDVRLVKPDNDGERDGRLVKPDNDGVGG